jgi:hypothetical protein
MVKSKPTDIPHREHCEVKVYLHSSHRDNGGMQTTDIPDKESMMKCKPTDITHTNSMTKYKPIDVPI